MSWKNIRPPDCVTFFYLNRLDAGTRSGMWSSRTRNPFRHYHREWFPFHLPRPRTKNGNFPVTDRVRLRGIDRETAWKRAQSLEKKPPASRRGLRLRNILRRTCINLLFKTCRSNSENTDETHNLKKSPDVFSSRLKNPSYFAGRNTRLKIICLPCRLNIIV